MAEIKLTKNQLRLEQTRLQQLQKYLPTLQLKKTMLQVEVLEARAEIAECETVYNRLKDDVEHYSPLLAESISINLQDSAKILKINRRYENIAGVEVPYFEGLEFADFNYDLFETPSWVDPVIKGLRGLTEANVRIKIAQEKREALEREWREVSIRVNLFEKILIPRAIKNIKKIKVFLGDQQLAAVSQAKVAKAKIESRKDALAMEFDYAL
jgi:V/A-type H+/Na+-transporting ATPase subunit D